MPATSNIPRRSRSRHGMSKSPEYDAFNAMHQRCTNPRHGAYKYYGARGITVCEQWKDFGTFLADMGPRPSVAHSIDRIDNNGSYSPDNCRWATKKQQMQNRRSKRMEMFTHKGETHTCAEWARITGIDLSTLMTRLFRAKWTIANALDIPVSTRNRSHDFHKKAIQ